MAPDAARRNLVGNVTNLEAKFVLALPSFAVAMLTKFVASVFLTRTKSNEASASKGIAVHEVVTAHALP